MTNHCLYFLLFSYLLGSIPFGRIIAGKVAAIDITQHGSGNIGATNVARVVHIKWGLLTLALDMLKGYLPVLLYSLSAFCPQWSFDYGLSFVALAALLGHQFSIFGKFRGGKGVATALGIYLVISPSSCLCALGTFLLVTYKWRFISLGSMISVFTMPILLALFGETAPIIGGSCVTAFLILMKHRQNIERLFKGQENRWGKSPIRR